MTQFRANIPDFRVTVDGKDITPTINPRLISLNLSERRGDDGDQFDLVLDDADGTLAIPRLGVAITLQLGWKRGSQVEPGLVDKGSFTVDEVEWSDAPGTLTIRARSADFTGALTTRRDKSWHDTTVGAIVREVAGRNALTPRIAPALAGIAVKAFSQSRESDIALLRRLGREHDAVATIKGGALILAPVGAATTVSGKPIPSITIRRRDGDRATYRVEKREESKGVTATWHDRKGAAKKEVTVGEADGARRLSRTYPSEAAARAAAQAELKHAARQPLSLSLTLALGRADLSVEQKVTAEGWRDEINGQPWRVAEVTHTLSERGYTTALKLDVGST